MMLKRCPTTSTAPCHEGADDRHPESDGRHLVDDEGDDAGAEAEGDQPRVGEDVAEVAGDAVEGVQAEADPRQGPFDPSPDQHQFPGEPGPGRPDPTRDARHPAASS